MQRATTTGTTGTITTTSESFEIIQDTKEEEAAAIVEADKDEQKR